MRTFRKTQGVQVATVAEGAIVGKLDDFQFNLETGSIYGFRLKGPGVFGKSGGLPSSALALFGRDLVLVSGESVIEWGGTRNAEDGRAWASEYRGTRVMSRRGEALGQVDDYVIESGPPRILGLLLNDDRVVALDARVAVGRDAVIVEEAGVVRTLTPASPDPESTDWWTRVRGMFGAPGDGGPPTGERKS